MSEVIVGADEELPVVDISPYMHKSTDLGGEMERGQAEKGFLRVYIQRCYGQRELQCHASVMTFTRCDGT